MWHHLGAYVAAFGHQVGQIWHSWGAWVAPWAPQRVTMSAIWLPKGWLWGTKGVTFGTMGEPWWPQGAKTRPWKGKNTEIADGFTVLRGVHGGAMVATWSQDTSLEGPKQ